MKISILTSDFSHNCFGRTWLLAEILKNHYPIEIVGPQFGSGIWEPLSNLCNFETKIVSGYDNGKFEFKKMERLITGDVIYACKPLLASFGLGLIGKIRYRKPLVLDIDDWQLGFGKEFFDSLSLPKKIMDCILSLSNFRSYYYALLLNNFVPLADDITVSGEILQNKYGGSIIWHGRDINIFDPGKFNRILLKKKYLPESSQKSFVVGFIGTPRPHKGISDLIRAIDILNSDQIILFIAGLGDDEYSCSIKSEVKKKGLEDKVFLAADHPFEKLPELLSIIDLIVIPQRKSLASYGQVPAKIFDAMAMAKPIIATNLPQHRKILKDCGWIVEAENPRNLADQIEYVFTHPEEAMEKASKARKNCESHYSMRSVEKKLITIFDRFR